MICWLPTYGEGFVHVFPNPIILILQVKKLNSEAKWLAQRRRILSTGVWPARFSCMRTLKLHRLPAFRGRDICSHPFLKELLRGKVCRGRLCNSFFLASPPQPSFLALTFNWPKRNEVCISDPQPRPTSSPTNINWTPCLGTLKKFKTAPTFKRVLERLT